MTEQVVTTPTGADGAAATPGVQTTTQAPANKPDDGPKMFSQEAVNSLLANQKRDIQGKYADYDDLKKKSEGYDGDIEKAKAEAREETLSEARFERITTKAETIAKDLHFVNPSEVAQILDKEKQPLKEVDGKKVIDEDALKAAVEKLAKDKPYLITQERSNPLKRRPSLPSGKAPEGEAGGKSKLSAAEAIRQMRAQKNHS